MGLDELSEEQAEELKVRLLEFVAELERGLRESASFPLSTETSTGSVESARSRSDTVGLRPSPRRRSAWSASAASRMARYTRNAEIDIRLDSSRSRNIWRPC